MNDKFIKDFVLQESRLKMWNFSTKDNFPLWSFIRNAILFRMISRNPRIFPAKKALPFLAKQYKEISRLWFHFSFSQKEHDSIFITPASGIICNKIDRIHGGWYLFFDNPLVIEIPQDYSFSRIINGVPPGNVYSNALLSASRHFFAKVYQRKSIYFDLETEREITSRTIKLTEGEIDEIWISRQLKAFAGKWEFYRILSDRFSKITTNKIFFLNCACYLGDNAILSWHLHRNGFTVIEQQHGYIGKDHPSYFYDKALQADSRIKKVFPDYLLTFGEEWGRKIQIPSKVSNIGNKLIQDYSKSSNSSEVFQKSMLIISQGTVTNAMVKLSKELSNVLDGFSITFRPHPGESHLTDIFDDLDKFNNIKVDSSTNILDLINRNKFVVGYNSTSLFEALAFKNKVVFCTENSYTKEELNFNFYESPQDLAKNIDSSNFKTTSGEASRYWGNSWHSRASDFIKSLNITKQ